MRQVNSQVVLIDYLRELLDISIQLNLQTLCGYWIPHHSQPKIKVCQVSELNL